LTVIADRHFEKAQALAEKLDYPPKIILPPKEVAKVADIIIEAASQEATGDVVKDAVMLGKECIVLSIGGLLNHLYLFDEAKRTGATIYIPSGAICGIDGVIAGKLGKINNITITTRKPPLGYAGAPFILKHKINLTNLTGEHVLLETKAIEAIKEFPANINVAATLSLAGLGPAFTKVRIIADSNISVNIHEVYIEGEFGRLYTRTESYPFPNNPKTSYLAALSALATLKSITQRIKFLP